MTPEAEPLLCILIPTYKRAEQLAQLLRTYREVLRDNPDVRIVVSNNDPLSTDAEAIVAELALPQITYVHQRVNLGPIIHLCWLLGQSTGRYTWLHSDDDIMTPEELRLVFSAIRENPGCAYFFMTATWGDESSDRLPENKIWDSGIDLYSEKFPKSTLITTGIYRTKEIHSMLGGMVVFSSYFFVPISVAAAGSGAGCCIQGVRIKAGSEFSVKGKIKQRKIFYNQLYEEVLQCDGLNYRQKCVVLWNDFFRFYPHRTMLVALFLFETVMFIRLLVRHPMVVLPALPFHGVAAVSRFIKAIFG